MNELYRYLTLALAPEWRRLPAAERAAQKRELAEAASGEGTRIHAYSLVGTRADADLLLWAVGDDLERVRALEVRLAATRLWSYSSRPYAYLAARRRSPYLGGHAHDGSEHARGDAGPAGDKAYVVIYPMVKKRSWYALTHEERTRMMAKHFEVGHRYPDIRIHTGYSFGIDDQEFVVAFEGADPAEFLDLVQDLRYTRASSYTLRDTPMFTCVLRTPAQLVEEFRVGAGALAR